MQSGVGGKEQRGYCSLYGSATGAIKSTHTTRLLGIVHAPTLDLHGLLSLSACSFAMICREYSGPYEFSHPLS
jgi:hypothetical protein